MRADRKVLAAELAGAQRQLEAIAQVAQERRIAVERLEQDRIRLQRSVDLISVTAMNYQQNLADANQRLAQQESGLRQSQLLVQQLRRELEEARSRSVGEGVTVGPAGDGGAVRISFVSSVPVVLDCERSVADIEDGLPDRTWTVVFVPPTVLGEVYHVS